MTGPITPTDRTVEGDAQNTDFGVVIAAGEATPWRTMFRLNGKMLV
jgi:hypothetical protein